MMPQHGALASFERRLPVRAAHVGLARRRAVLRDSSRTPPAATRTRRAVRASWTALERSAGHTARGRSLWAARIVKGLAGFRFFAEAAAEGEPRGPFDGTSPTRTATDLGLCSAGGAPNGGSKNGLPDPAHAGGEPTARAVCSRPPGARVVAVVGSKCLSVEPVASMASRATAPT